jgi:hypothetical protein
MKGNGLDRHDEQGAGVSKGRIKNEHHEHDYLRKYKKMHYIYVSTSTISCCTLFCRSFTIECFIERQPTAQG